MIAPLVCALGWLATVAPPAESPPPVALVPFDCGTVTDANVRPALAVELQGRLLDEPGPIPSAVVAVSASCRGADVILAAASPGRVGPPLRLVSLAGLAENARPRAVALAVAELVRPPDAVAETSLPLPEAATLPAKETDRPYGHIVIGPSGGGFASNPSIIVGGAHFRSSYLWAKARGEALSRWWFGSFVDFNFSAASFWNGNGELSITSAGLGFLAERPGSRWTPAFAIGDRFGSARFTNDVGPDPTAKTFVASAFAEVALRVLVGPLHLRLGAELDLPVVPPGRFCSTECVDFSGPWLVTTLDLVMKF